MLVSISLNFMLDCHRCHVARLHRTCQHRVACTVRLGIVLCRVLTQYVSASCSSYMKCLHRTCRYCAISHACALCVCIVLCRILPVHSLCLHGTYRHRAVSHACAVCFTIRASVSFVLSHAFTIRMLCRRQRALDGPGCLQWLIGAVC